LYSKSRRRAGFALRTRAGFLFEPADDARIIDEAAMQHFEGNVTIVRGIAGQINDAEPPFAELFSKGGSVRSAC